jgi:hypothetical protein
MVKPRNKKGGAAARIDSSSSDVSNSDKLDTILERLARLDTIEEKLANVESLLAATQAENAVLKAKTEAQETTILDLKNKLNSLEQHGRSFSIRINNVPLDGVDEREPPAIIKKVYDTAFLPILQGAASKGAISAVPSCYEMVEMAHTLPGSSGRAKPIIVRFFNRNLKSLLFRHRKEFAPKGEIPGTSSSNNSKQRYLYPFQDDLTRDTYIKMKKLQSDPRVYACWSTSGTLRFKLAENGDIKKVPSVYLSNDDIVKL